MVQKLCGCWGLATLAVMFFQTWLQLQFCWSPLYPPVKGIAKSWHSLTWISELVKVNSVKCVWLAFEGRFWALPLSHNDGSSLFGLDVSVLHCSSKNFSESMVLSPKMAWIFFLLTNSFSDRDVTLIPYGKWFCIHPIAGIGLRSVGCSQDCFNCWVAAAVRTRFVQCVLMRNTGGIWICCPGEDGHHCVRRLALEHCSSVVDAGICPEHISGNVLWSLG